MAYEVLAQKWRPQKFSDVVGQEHVITVLQNQIKNDRVGHAYLFWGPRGTGKTTLARLFAKTVNCNNLWEGEPCNNCKTCTEITNERSIDVMEMDAASNRGIESIRDLREKVKLTPTTCNYKVYIIDEVHMLTKESFNALLKTLEEPPDQVMFLMATTEYDSIPKTIISRCQDFELHYLHSEKIIPKLQKIAEDEGITVDTDTLSLLVKHSDGCLRDAENLLERVTSSIPDKTLTIETAEKILGLTSSNTLKELADSILTKDLTNSLIILDRLSKQGVSLAQCNSDLINYFRKLRLLTQDNREGTLSKSLDITSVELDELKAKSQGVDTVFLSRIIKILIKTSQDIKMYAYEQLQLENALIQINTITTSLDLNKIVEKFAELEHKLDLVLRDPDFARQQVISIPDTTVKEIPAVQQPVKNPNKVEVTQPLQEPKKPEVKKTAKPTPPTPPKKKSSSKKPTQRDLLLEKERQRAFSEKKDQAEKDPKIKNVLNLFDAEIVEFK